MEGGFIALLTGVVSSPAVTLRHIAQVAPFGTAAWTLLGLGTLFVLGGTAEAWMPYRRQPPQQNIASVAGIFLGVSIFLLPCLWMWIAAITMGLLSLFAVRANLEGTFCLLVFAGAPQFIGWIAYPLRNLNLIEPCAS